VKQILFVIQSKFLIFLDFLYQLSCISCSPVIVLRSKLFLLQIIKNKCNCGHVRSICLLIIKLNCLIENNVFISSLVLLLNYATQVYDEFVLSGNTAVLRCNIPSSVKNHVEIASWIQDSSEVISALNFNYGNYLWFTVV